MWCRASADTSVNALDWVRTRHVSAMITMSPQSSGVLMRGSLVGKIPPEPYAKASTRENDEANDPHPYGHAIRTALRFAKPRTLLLRIRFSALFSGDHAETPPEVVTFFATSRKKFLFRIPAYYRFGTPFNVSGFSGL